MPECEPFSMLLHYTYRYSEYLSEELLVKWAMEWFDQTLKLNGAVCI